MSRKWRKRNKMAVPAPNPSNPLDPPPAPPPGILDRWDFLWKTHSYLNDYIRFADTKAAIVIVLSTAILGGLVSVKAHHWCGPSRLDLENAAFRETMIGIGAFASFAFLNMAFSCAILALAPRLWVQKVTGIVNTVKHWFKDATTGTPATPGFIFWIEILNFPDRNAYWEAVKTSTKDSLEEHLTKRLYDLSALANEKFLFVNRGIIFLLIGAVVGGLFLLGSS